MRRASMLGLAAAAVLALGLGGWAAAGALASAPRVDADTASGRGLQVRYELRREPPYTPPPATEATRLDVLTPSSPTRVEDGVLSAQAGEALRSLQAEDASRTALALAAVRAQDARIDRETASALEAARDQETVPGPAEGSQPAPADTSTRS